MAKFDFRKLVNDSTETLKSSTQKVQEALKNADIQAVANDMSSKGKDAANFIKHKADEALQTVSNARKRDEELHGLFTVDGTLKLMCMIMSADGDIADEELTQIHDIGTELDEQFPEYQDELISECTALVNKFDSEAFQEDYNDAVRDIIQNSFNVPGATIPVKLLLWNLLVVAQSDNTYLDKEGKLIRYIAKHLGLDKSIVPEMESSIRALLAVEQEISWIKTTNRPFAVVEPILCELSDRKAAIMQGVHMLIND